MTPLLSLVSQPWAHTLGWTLLHFIWQGAVLGLLAWVALALLRGADAKLRYSVACAFLVLMVVAPIATYLLLKQPEPPPATLVLTAEAQASAATPTALVQRVQTTLDPALPWLLATWMMGVLLLSTRLLGSWLRVQRLRRLGASPVPAEWHLVLSRLCRELGLTRTVRLLQSAVVEVPTALGWLRPVILLPACAFSGLSPLQLEAILAHELAHIRRGDFLVNLLQSLVEVLLFYHPAVWWLSARIRAERELCCDDVAAQLCGDPLLLARALTELEALREPDSAAPNQLALAANGGSLMHRIRHLLEPALPVTSGARATALAVLAASLLSAAGVALQDKEPSVKPDKTTRIQTSDDKRKLDVRMKGEVKLNGEAPDPVVVSGDGSFRVQEKKEGKTRAYAATKDKATYTVDGQEKVLDKEGKGWLRGIATEAVKAQAGREHAKVMRIHAEGERARDEARHTRVIEIQAKELEDASRTLATHAAELEANTALSTEDRKRIQAEMDQARAELEKAKAESRKMHVERIERRGTGTIVVHEGGDGDKRVEVLTEDVHPGVGKDGKPKNVVVKRYKIKQDGVPGQDREFTIDERGDEEELGRQIERNIHMPRIHVRTMPHPGGEDPQAEMAEIKAELRALQARLDQLQRNMATTPKAPTPPPPPPPPPPPAPEAPPAPPAPTK